MVSQDYMMVKAWVARYEADICAVCILCLGIILAGGITRLAFVWQDHQAVDITGTEWGSIEPLPAEALMVAASKHGTRYYYPWCGGISRIKEANKVWFTDARAAEAAGYTKASGCEGL